MGCLDLIIFWVLREVGGGGEGGEITPKYLRATD